MKQETFEAWRQGDYFLRLKSETVDKVHRVLLEGDARTKVLYEGKDPFAARRIFGEVKAKYEAQKT